MRLVIFSDNHRDIDSIQWIITHNPGADRYITLGDSEMREHELTNLGVFGVKGNYPFEPDFPYDMVMEFGGWNTLLTHGHRYFVKTGLYNLKTKAESLKSDLVLFGHTHQALIRKEDGILFVNPGSTTNPKSGIHRTYGIIILDADSITIEIREIETDVLIAKHVDRRMERGDEFGL
jgi:uncharacterized protein